MVKPSSIGYLLTLEKVGESVRNHCLINLHSLYRITIAMAFSLIVEIRILVSTPPHCGHLAIVTDLIPEAHQ
jgi:hypothetical protein